MAKSLKLYHYTDKQGYIGMKRSKRINKTRASSRHAKYGAGVYFTRLKPKVGIMKIARNNYTESCEAMMRNGRVDYYVEVVFDERDVELVEDDFHRNIYLYRGRDVDLNEFEHNFGETPTPSTWK